MPTVSCSMKLKASTWFRYCLFSGVVVLPLLVIALLFANSPVLIVLRYCAIAALVFCGASGAVVAILLKCGRLTIVYSKRDLDDWFYSMNYDVTVQVFGIKSVVLDDNSGAMHDN